MVVDVREALRQDGARTVKLAEERRLWPAVRPKPIPDTGESPTARVPARRVAARSRANFNDSGCTPGGLTGGSSTTIARHHHLPSVEGELFLYL
jgi:hypothetical protein